MANLTIISSENPSMLTKKFTIGPDGNLVKKIGGQLIRGTFEVVATNTPADLAERLGAAKHNQAFCYGVPLNGQKSGTIASRKEAKNGDITRTNTAIGFEAGPGWMLLDIDPGDRDMGAPDSSWEEIYNVLERCIPGFRKNVPHVLSHSASTFLYKTADGVCVKGEGGKRVYVLVSNADDIPRAGKELYRRMQARGCLHYFVTKSGSLCDRSLIDGSVFTAERLDFIAGALCGAGLEQRRPRAEAINNDAPALDTGEAIKNLESFEERDIDNLKIAARALVENRRIEMRELWLANNMKHRPKDMDVAEFRKILDDSVEHSLLDQSFPIILEDGTRVYVAEILSNPRHFHERACFDPLEPDYDGARAVGKLYLTGARPLVFSFAHGGKKYFLNKQKHMLQVVEGHTEDLTDACIAKLAANNVIYRCENTLCDVSGKLITETDELESHLDRQIRFFSTTAKKTTKNMDCPAKVARRMLIKPGQWQFFHLGGVTPLPVLRLDGSILDVPGYDHVSQLIYDVEPSDEVPSVPAAPTDVDVRDALRRLWAPFRLFPFAGPADKGAALAAMLTTAVRQVLPSAPGFLINAPAYGTGKTLFALSIAAMTGMSTCVRPWPKQAEEQLKSLTAGLRGGYGTFILDNLEGNLRSPDLAAIFTTPVWTTRILGKSEDISMRTNCMIMATGNNVYPIQDLSRRFCTIRINADVGRPELRVFDFSPKTLIEADVPRFRCDVLTVLRGFVCSGAPRGSADVLGSFEDWDRLVRQCVIWCKDKMEVEIDDPMLTQNDNYETDPDQMKLANLLTAWHDVFGDREVTVGILIAGALAMDKDHPEGATLLEEAVMAIVDDNVRSRAKILGWFLERHKDCISEGIQLKKLDKQFRRACVYQVLRHG